ncbi:hypothetical protein D1872_196440 [compost metagenome]
MDGGAFLCKVVFIIDCCFLTIMFKGWYKTLQGGVRLCGKMYMKISECPNKFHHQTDNNRKYCIDYYPNKERFIENSES